MKVYNGAGSPSEVLETVTSAGLMSPLSSGSLMANDERTQDICVKNSIGTPLTEALAVSKVISECPAEDGGDPNSDNDAGSPTEILEIVTSAGQTSPLPSSGSLMAKDERTQKCKRFTIRFFIGLMKWLLQLLLIFIILVALLILIPNLPPYTTFSKIGLEQTQPRVGALAPNEVLNNAERLYKDKLLGPEAFELYNGDLYTSLATGEIVKLSTEGHVTFVTTVGQPCNGLVQEHICGRPLGFKIDEKNNTMYIADAYYGVWKVDLKTDEKQLLVSPRVEIGGQLPKLFNSVALSNNGDVYWTDSTSDFHLKDGMFSALTDPSGRLFHYIAAKNESQVLLDNFWFANGLVISPDNQFVVVAETFHYRLMKYYINGPNKGKSEVFVAGLPGNPDNLRELPDGSGLLVALHTAIEGEDLGFLRFLAERPNVRKFIVRLLRLYQIIFESLDHTFPNYIFGDIVYHIGNFVSISGLSPSISGLLNLDWNGNVVASYFNTDGSLGHASDAIVHNGTLYTGSPHMQNFIGSAPAPPSLLKAFTTKKVEIIDVPQISPKRRKSEPVQQVLKPKVQENISATSPYKII